MGHMMKLTDNFLGLINVAVISEILPIAVKYGLDPKVIWNVVRVSGGNSKAFEGLAPRILKGTFNFSLELNKAYKDILYVSNLARELQAPLLCRLQRHEAEEQLCAAHQKMPGALH
jgi:3-hydroxyisobutyrate dehydrogenase